MVAHFVLQGFLLLREKMGASSNTVRLSKIPFVLSLSKGSTVHRRGWSKEYLYLAGGSRSSPRTDERTVLGLGGFAFIWRIVEYGSGNHSRLLTPGALFQL